MLSGSLNLSNQVIDPDGMSRLVHQFRKNIFYYIVYLLLANDTKLKDKTNISV